MSLPHSMHQILQVLSVAAFTPVSPLPLTPLRSAAGIVPLKPAAFADSAKMA